MVPPTNGSSVFEPLPKFIVILNPSSEFIITGAHPGPITETFIK